MGWFVRNVGDGDRGAAAAALEQAVDDCGLVDALDRAAGRGGLRRFLLQFVRRGDRVRLNSLDAEALPSGGPPDPTTFEARAASLERVVEDLRRRLPPGFDFDKLYVGFVRNQPGVVAGGPAPTTGLDVTLRFDEDTDGFGLSALPMPKGKGSPVETAAYQRALGQWSSQIVAVQQGWIQPGEGEDWSLHGTTLRVGRPGDQERRFVVETLATFVPHTGDFTWVLDRVAGEEAPFREKEMRLELERALELVMFAAARLGHKGIFQGEAEEPAGLLIFAGLRE